MKYVQEFARNYSLFHVLAYTTFSKRPSPEYNVAFDVGHPLFIFDPDEGPLAKIYHREGGLKKLFSRIGQATADEKFFTGVLSKFGRAITDIEPYFEKKKVVKNLDEFKVLYELFLDFTYGEAIVWVAPLVESLSEELKKRALVSREETENLTSMRDEVLDYNLAQLFPGLGDLAHYVSPESVFGGKSGNELKKEAEEYKKGFVCFDGQFYTEDKKKVLNNLNIEVVDIEPQKDVNSFKGQIASKGVAKGQVKLVFLTKDTEKVVNGDILVSPMTRPDFLPAMKHAVAYITDEGGITCHAAIVARELKKPCIIGTKIATKVLKDDDLVEVDANKGIVKILKKK